MSFLNSIGRSMARDKRVPPRRSPTTPTSGGGFYDPQQPSSNASSPLPPPSPIMHPHSPAQQMIQRPLYMCSPYVEASVVKGNFKTIILLPRYVDVTEWVAVNIFDFYTNLNLFYGVIAECCTTQSCPTMSAGYNLDYTWIDQNRRQVKLAAPTYIDYVMTWVQNLLDDENVFPTKAGREFPPNFPSTIKHVYRQLLRVFAHIFHAHYHQLLHLRSEPHFNTLFAHFLAFGREYDLLDPKDIKGSSGAPVGVGELYEKWKEMGMLEG